MLPLFKLITLRHIVAEKTRTLLTLTGIALGVALFVSVRLANESILHAFRGTIDAVAGKTTLQITCGDAGLDETVLALVRDEPGVVAVAPVLQTLAAAEGVQEPLMVMGVDPLSEGPFRDYSFSLDNNLEADFLDFLLDPHTIFLTESFARAHGYSTGSTIRLLVDDQAHEFMVRGLLEFEGTARAMQGNFAIMDIATYQWRFGRVGRLDRIDLITQEGINLQEVIQRLLAKLPQGIVVDRPQRRGAQVERMLAAFQLNLIALSAIALLVALFLMYNTMTMAVVRRRTEIGVLRCLGVSANVILGLFIAEAFALGLIGGLVGVPAGWFLAQWTLQAMGQTVTSLYTPVIVKTVVMRPSILMEGLALGCVVALVAGVVSVREATRVVPREVLHRGSEEASRKLSYVKTSFIGILLLLAALFFSQLPPIDLKPIFGYASALFLLLGFACLVPLTTVLLHSLIHRLPLNWTSTELKLASNSLVSALGRSSMAVTAILTGLAMMGGMMIMIHSFRATVGAWINQTISADLFVIPAARSVSGLEARMPEKVLEELSAVPGIKAIDPVQTLKIPLNTHSAPQSPQLAGESGRANTKNQFPTRVEESSQLAGGFFNNEQVMLAVRDLEVVKNHSHLLMVNGNTQEIMKQALEKGEVLVSEPLAFRRGIKPGDHLNLQTPTGLVSLIVAGVFYDYTTDGGRILMDRRLFRQHWQENRITTLAVYLQPEASAEAIRQDILKHLGKAHRLIIISNRELRAEIINIFDQTFAITYALEVIAVMVAILGVMNTLFTTILGRRRELAVLRVLGSTQTQMSKIILYEALLISLVGITLGLGASFLLSQILIHVINKQSFGWTILFHPSWIALTRAALFVLLASLLSAYLPAQRASKIKLTEALQYE